MPKKVLTYYINDPLGKVVDLVTGEALPAGERGELCIKGPQVTTVTVI